MEKRSLQNDNKSRPKKRGFFDEAVNAQTEERTDTDVSAAVKVEESTEEAASFESGKHFKTAVAIFLCVTVLFLAVSAALGGADFFTERFLSREEEEEEGALPTIFTIVDADWETDIFKLDEYLALRPDWVWYKENGHEQGGDTRELYYEMGGKNLLFLVSYFDAVKRGDHEAVNSMLTEDYVEENGLYKDFPMQKIFDIRVEEIYPSESEQGRYQNDYYFKVSYKIYKNDGLFNNQCDEDYSCNLVFMTFIDDDGNGKINRIMPAYT